MVCSQLIYQWSLYILLSFHCMVTTYPTYHASNLANFSWWHSCVKWTMRDYIPTKIVGCNIHPLHNIRQVKGFLDGSFATNSVVLPLDVEMNIYTIPITISGHIPIFGSSHWTLFEYSFSRSCIRRVSYELFSDFDSYYWPHRISSNNTSVLPNWATLMLVYWTMMRWLWREFIQFSIQFKNTLLLPIYNWFHINIYSTQYTKT